MLLLGALGRARGVEFTLGWMHPGGGVTVVGYPNGFNLEVKRDELKLKL